MSAKIILPKMDEGCTHLEGYRLGFDDAYVQLAEQVKSLIVIKSEHDRAFCLIRELGITKEEAKSLSVALAALQHKHRKEIILLKHKVNQNEK